MRAGPEANDGGPAGSSAHREQFTICDGSDSALALLSRADFVHRLSSSESPSRKGTRLILLATDAKQEARGFILLEIVNRGWMISGRVVALCVEKDWKDSPLERSLVRESLWRFRRARVHHVWVEVPLEHAAVLDAFEQEGAQVVDRAVVICGGQVLCRVLLRPYRAAKSL